MASPRSQPHYMYTQLELEPRHAARNALPLPPCSLGGSAPPYTDSDRGPGMRPVSSSKMYFVPDS